MEKVAAAAGKGKEASIASASVSSSSRPLIRGANDRSAPSPVGSAKPGAGTSADTVEKRIFEYVRSTQHTTYRLTMPALSYQPTPANKQTN
jgi:hypothetical protein